MVGEKVEYECKVNNKLPGDLDVDKVEMVFLSRENPNIKFKVGVYPKDGENTVKLAHGESNAFTFSGASSSSGSFYLDHFALTIGKLVVVKKYKDDQEILATVLATPPSAVFIATFPSKY